MFSLHYIRIKIIGINIVSGQVYLEVHMIILQKVELIIVIKFDSHELEKYIFKLSSSYFHKIN